ncbi:MAG: hypothetical protein M0Q15_16105 [Nevskia sp.]|nr:hypothetical protein [Nevskia sp.]
MTKAYTLLTSLVPRLQAILIVNGYATNAGASVLLGPVPRQDGEAFPFCRLHETSAEAESAVPHRPAAKIRVNFVAEACTEQAAAASVLATGHQLIGDLKKALFGDLARDLEGAAIDARLEGYSVLPPEDGSDIVIAQVRGSFTFHDTFNTP